MADGYSWMTDENALIQSVYAVTVEPQRYGELVNRWVEKLSSSLLNLKLGNSNDKTDLNEHVRRATEVIGMLAASQADDLVSESARSTAHPRMLADVKGRLIRVNPPAKQAYGLKDTGNLRDLPIRPAVVQELRSIVQQLVNNPAGSAAQNQSCLLVRAQRTDTDQTIYVSLACVQEEQQRLVELSTTDIIWPERLSPLLQQSFEFTPAETSVAKHLVMGLSIAEIAEARSASVGTVRVQLHSIFDKTSTSGQSEFIRMAIGLAALYPDSDALTKAPVSAAEAPGFVLPPTLKQRTLFTLSDGRKMDYADFGARRGERVVMYFHDAMFGLAWPPALVKQLERENIRIIAPARQYWGRTDPYPEGTTSYMQHAQDVRELCEYLRLENVLLVARVIGSIYAYTLTQLDPGRYIGLLGVAPALPFEQEDEIKAMQAHQQLVTASANRSTSFLHFVNSAGSAIYNRFGAQRLIHMMYQQSPADLASAAKPDCLATMSQGMADAAIRPTSPFAFEFRDNPPPGWRQNLKLDLPFHAMLGSADPSKRKLRLDRMQARGVQITVQTLPDVGELFFYSHSHDVGEQVLRMFDGDPNTIH